MLGVWEGASWVVVRVGVGECFCRAWFAVWCEVCGGVRGVGNGLGVYMVCVHSRLFIIY